MFNRKTEPAAPTNQSGDTPATVSKPPNGAMTPARSGGLLSRGVSIKGSVKFLNELVVDGEVEGTIDKIWVENGAQVKAGDVLLHFDTSVEEAQLAAANARFELAKLQRTRAPHRVLSILAQSPRR